MEPRPYSLSRRCQRSIVLQAIGLSFNKTTLHLIVPRMPLNESIKLLLQETPDFIGPDLWPSNSTHLRRVDYRPKVWGAMQRRVYECCMNSVNELKPHWSLEQSVVERYWRGHPRMEKATESVCACRWTTFIVSACDWQSTEQIKCK